MRKVVVYSLLAALTLAGLLAPDSLMQQPAQAQSAAPTVNVVAPDIMPAGSNGFTLRLEGRGFVEGARVLLDGTPLAKPRLSGKKGRILLAEVPAEVVATPGTHTVQAVNPDGTTSAAKTLTVVTQEPGLRMFLGGNATQEEPGSDLAFDVIGEGFSENSVALIWGTEAVETTFVSETNLIVQIAEALLNDPATIPILIRNRGNRYSNADNFFVVSRPARISSVEPQRTEVSATDLDVVLRGNFKDGAVVVVNGMPLATEQDRGESRLRTKIPAALLAQPAQLFLRVEQEGVQSSDIIITVEPTEGPFIYEIAPTRIVIGESKQNVDIYGANLGGEAKVLINGEEAAIRESGKSFLRARIPQALLETPGNITIQVKDADDNLTQTFTIQIANDVTVTTLVGDGRDGFTPAGCVPAETARFRRPRRISVGPDSLLYVTDQQNHAIRTVNQTTGEVCTVAGTGEFGYHDSGNAAGKAPTFAFPNGVAVGGDGSILVTENGNHVVRRIVRSAGGVTVDTVAGTTEPIIEKPRQDRFNATQVGVEGFREGAARTSAFRKPDDIVAAPDGSYYFTDPGNHSIRRLVQSGSGFMVETFAGNGVPGYIDGAGDVARFNTPTGLALSPDGAFLYVADTANNRIRRINLATRRVETVAGDGTFAGIDGPGHLAAFGAPIGLAFDTDGTLYVSEFGRNAIRRVDPQGNVTFLAGADKLKFREGPGLTATFNAPRGIAIDRGILYVADTENFRIRKIVLR